MKKILSILLAALLVFAVAGCSTTGDNKDNSAKPTDGNSSKKEFTIGYSFTTVNNEFWAKTLDCMEAASKDLGFKLMANNCNNDQAKQINDVESMISLGIDGLVLAPQDASVCPGIVNSCKKNNIPIVIIDRSPGEDLVAGEDFIAFIGPNDEEAGYNIAKELIDSGAKKIVALGGVQSTSVGENRKKGLEKALKEHPEVKLLQFEWAGDNWDDGDRVFRSILSAHGDMDGVWCFNDSLALASVNVLKEQNKIKDIKVGGMDLIESALESLENKELFYSTGGHYTESGFGAVIIYDALNGIKYAGEPITKLDLLSITQENVSKYKEQYIKSNNSIDWKSYSKVYNPDGDIEFKLSLD